MFQKCFISQSSVELRQVLCLQMCPASICVVTPVCACQPAVLTASAAAGSRPEHRRNIDPVVETVVAGLCSDHYKAFVVDIVNAVIIQNAFDTSLHFSPASMITFLSCGTALARVKVDLLSLHQICKSLEINALCQTLAGCSNQCFQPGACRCSCCHHQLCFQAIKIKTFHESVMHCYCKVDYM